MQQLEQRLAHCEPAERDVEGHVSEADSTDNEMGFNPFHGGRSEDSSDNSSRQHRPRRNNVRERSIDFKVDIPEFDGRNDPNEFIDWLNSIESLWI